MDRIKQSDFLFPFIICSICVWRIFVPQLPANGGLGWDGYSYYQVAVDGFHSSSLTTLLAFRLFPSLLIHAILGISGIAFTPPHVILAFKVMNTVLITLSAMMVRQIFNSYKMDFMSQLTGFVLIFLNYGVLNFTYYYPVMTDTPAFALSIAIFYFFLRGDTVNIFLAGLIGAFTWPILFPMAVALILFPERSATYIPIKKSWQHLLSISCAAYALIAGWYFIFHQGEVPDMAYTLPLNKGMLPVSAICVAVLFFFMPYILFNRSFFDLKYYLRQLNGNRIFAIAIMIMLVLIIRNTMTVNTDSSYFSGYMILKNHHYGFLRPMITVVNHFNYFGCIMLLMILFWRKLSEFISTFGLGVSGSIFFNFVILAMLPESRTLVHLFSWLGILTSVFLSRYRFSSIFYATIIAINFAMAKLWLFFDYDSGNNMLPDGTIGFPHQWFFMHLGVWMTEHVWFYLLIITSLSLLLLILLLYNIKFGRKALLFYKNYEQIHHA